MDLNLRIHMSYIPDRLGELASKYLGIRYTHPGGTFLVLVVKHIGNLV